VEPVLIDGRWREASARGGFVARNPTTAEELQQTFPISDINDIEAALDAGRTAARELREVPRTKISDFLLAFATRIEDASISLAEVAHRETALPVEPRLASVEIPRTVDQIRQAAQAVTDRTWSTATIDTTHGIRSMFSSLGGPVAVFGPNNFPFAFNSVSGGDFVAAIAAGNPVIAKANTSHPMTTQLLAREAFAAVCDVGLPGATVQLIYRLHHEDGSAMAGNRRLGAIGFTGSRTGGLALKTAADAAGVPIYLEMSSVNPVFVLPGALADRGTEIAHEFFRSCTLGVGQFCTSPGIVVVPAGRAGDDFVDLCKDLFLAGDAGVLLGHSDHIADAITTLKSAGAEVLAGGGPVGDSGFRFADTLLVASGTAFLANPEALQSEAFGPVSLIVRARDIEAMVLIAGSLDGNLTGSIYADGDGIDKAAYNKIEPELRMKVGRLLNDKMPTGVAVSPAMNHGGPYPATGHPGFTAVGIPASIHRFAALHSYDNISQGRLPIELRDKNPNGSMYRLIDSHWTQADVATQPSGSREVKP